MKKSTGVIGMTSSQRNNDVSEMACSIKLLILQFRWLLTKRNVFITINNDNCAGNILLFFGRRKTRHR